MKMVNGQLVSDETDAPAIREGMYEAEFLSLAKKYKHHDGYACADRNCLVCQAIGTIINGQNDIDDAEQSKRREYALDEGIPF